MRDAFHESKLLTKCVQDIHVLLDALGDPDEGIRLGHRRLVGRPGRRSGRWKVLGLIMTVLVLTACPAGLRGHLTRWLLEISPGVFVGHVPARVRDACGTGASRCAGMAARSWCIRFAVNNTSSSGCTAMTGKWSTSTG